MQGTHHNEGLLPGQADLLRQGTGPLPLLLQLHACGVASQDVRLWGATGLQLRHSRHLSEHMPLPGAAPGTRPRTATGTWWPRTQRDTIAALRRYMGAAQGQVPDSKIQPERNWGFTYSSVNVNWHNASPICATCWSVVCTRHNVWCGTACLVAPSMSAGQPPAAQPSCICVKHTYLHSIICIVVLLMNGCRQVAGLDQHQRCGSRRMRGLLAMQPRS